MKYDKFGLCLDSYIQSKNVAEIYYKRAIGKLPEQESWVAWEDNVAAGKAHRTLGMSKIEDYVKTESSNVVATGAYRGVEPVFKQMKKVKDLHRIQNSKRDRISNMLAEIRDIENEITESDKTITESASELLTLLSA